MKNDLNVFDLLNGDRRGDPKKKRNDQERSASDPFFREAIREAIDRNSAVNGTSKQRRKNGGGARKFWKWIRRGWRWFVVQVILVFLVVWILFHGIINISLVSGDFMKPGICDGDRIIVFRLARTFKPGDIIVFRTDEGETRIKRVIAAEGDTVDISAQGALYINGEAVEEDDISGTTEITDQSVQYPVTVSEDSYFVLGDNREQPQEDSRNSEVGLIKKDAIIGRVVLSIRSF